MWVSLFSDRLEFSTIKKGDINNVMKLDHTSSTKKTDANNSQNDRIFHIETRGKNGRMEIFEAKNKAEVTIWEAALTGVITKLKSDKKLKPSVVRLKKELRRNSYLGLRFGRSSSVSSSPALNESFDDSNKRIRSAVSSFGGENLEPDFIDVAILEGYLQKRGHIRQSWTNRYFVLTSQRLTYFADSSMQEAKGFVTLNAYSYIQPRYHTKDSTHRQLFSLYTTDSLKDTDALFSGASTSTSDDVERHMLLMNGLNEDDVNSWCNEISKIIIQQKAMINFHLSMCVSTYIHDADLRSIVGGNNENFYCLKVVDCSGETVCEGHAYFADLKSLHASISDVASICLAETFPRSYRRNTFGVTLTEEILEKRRFKLELWLQDLIVCLSHVVDEERRDSGVDAIVTELGRHFSLSLDEVYKILSKEVALVPSFPQTGLSKLFGANGTDSDTDKAGSVTVVNESDKETAISEAAENGDGVVVNTSKLPSNPAMLPKLGFKKLVQLCKENNIDMTQFRTRGDCLKSLGEVYKAKLPYLEGKNARAVMKDLSKTYYANRTTVSKLHKSYSTTTDSATTPSVQHNKNTIKTIFNDTLVKLDVCPDSFQTLQDTRSTSEKITLINSTIQIWDHTLSFTSEDTVCVTSLLDPIGRLGPATVLLLKYRLVEAIHEPDWVHLFCAKKGVSGVVTQIQRHMDAVPLSKLAVVSIIDLVKCARLLVESGGRNSIVHTKTVIYTVALTLQFYEHSTLAIESLEFLTECIVYGGNIALAQIIHSLEYLATMRNEAPFEILMHMLAVDNLAVHCSVLSLVNSLVLYEKVTRNRVKVHSSINLLGFEKICGTLCSADLSNNDFSCKKMVEDVIRVHTTSTPSTSGDNLASKEQEKDNQIREENDSSDEIFDDAALNDEKCQLRPGVMFHESLLECRLSSDDKTPISPADGVMASYTQELVTESNFTEEATPGRNSVAKNLRRMTINIIEDFSTTSRTSVLHRSGSKSEFKLVEETRWLHLSHNILSIEGKNVKPSRILVNHISEVVDYGDFDTSLSDYSVIGCITVILSDGSKRFFHFGEHEETKNAWLVAFNVAIENELLKKALYSDQPSIPLPASLRHRFKKKFDKLFGLYRSIRDEDAIIVFNESIVPLAESNTASALSIGSLNHVELTRYVQYEFQRRKDVKLNMLLKELSIYFVKNYPPRLPENDKVEEVKESLPLAVVDSVRDVPRAPALPVLPPEKVVKPSCVKMKQIFWNKIKPVNVTHTLWGSLPEPEGVKWKLLEEKFGEAPVNRRRAIIKQSQSGDGDADKKKAINLFDSRRTQNVAIACAKLRMSPVEIYDIVLDMDPSELTLEVTEVILNLLLPTAEEVACLRAYTGNVDHLDYCGQLFSFFTRIEGLENRLIIQKIMLSWSDEAQYALSVLDDVTKVISELKDAKTLEPLQEIMAVVLTVGNYMNGANRTGRAHGFKLDTLLKLKDVREKKIPQRNLLHFVIEQFPTSDSSVFYSHWDTMWKVSKVSKGNVNSIINQLRESLEVCVSAIHSAGDIQNEMIRENLILRLGML